MNKSEMSHDEMYRIIVEKDARYEGMFFTGVKTTGIFCRPTCTARKPRIENVEFFVSAKEAMLSGYRACLVCKPLETPRDTPPDIRMLFAELEADLSRKISDAGLKSRGIEPHTVRRWFLRHHGMTFHAFQRLMRINQAVKQIHAGGSVTHSAFDSGYNSLSGFNESFKTVFGASPRNAPSYRVIDMTRIRTPLGMMVACANHEGVCLLEFADRKMLESELKYLSKALSSKILPGINEHLSTLKCQLTEYFEGSRKKFSVPLVTPGTAFQMRVWERLQQIPYGTVTTYQQQALKLNAPTAIRAVAKANGMNRISILIPCHRVIGSDGKLVGYGGGIWRKQALLALEQERRS